MKVQRIRLTGIYRAMLTRTICNKQKVQRKKRPFIDTSDLCRQWPDLNNKNSYPVPIKINSGLIKGELFRFYCTLLLLLKKYGSPLNYSDKAFAKDFKFHTSRICKYKDRLEELQLIAVARSDAGGKLIWPKSYYYIWDFWNDEQHNPPST